MNFSSPGGRESFTLGHIFSTFLLPPKGHLGGLATPFFFLGIFFSLGEDEAILRFAQFFNWVVQSPTSRFVGIS